MIAAGPTASGAPRASAPGAARPVDRVSRRSSGSIAAGFGRARLEGRERAPRAGVAVPGVDLLERLEQLSDERGVGAELGGELEHAGLGVADLGRPKPGAGRGAPSA